MALTEQEKQVVLQLKQQGKTSDEIKQTIAQNRITAPRKTIGQQAQDFGNAAVDTAQKGLEAAGNAATGFTESITGGQPVNDFVSQKMSLIDQNIPKPQIRKSAIDEFTGNVGKGFSDIWKGAGDIAMATPGAVAGAAGATWDAATHPVETINAFGQATTKPLKAAIADPGILLKAPAEMVAGAAAEVPKTAGNLIGFTGDVLGGAADVLDPEAVRKQGFAKAVAEMEKRGEYVDPRLYEYINSRPGDFFRTGSKAARKTEAAIESGVTGAAEAIGLNPKSLASGVGRFVTQLSVSSALAKTFGLDQAIPEKIKGTANLGTKVFSTAENPTVTRKIARDTLNMISNKAQEWAPVIKSGTFTTAINDAVTRGETNSASILTGILLSRVLQGASDKMKKGAVASYQGALPYQAPEQGKGVGKRALESYKKSTEEALKRGWTANTTDDYLDLVRSEKSVALDKAQKIIDASKSKVPVAELEKQFQKAADYYRNDLKIASEADAIMNYFNKNIKANSKKVLSIADLKKIKEGNNQILKALQPGQQVGPKLAEETTYALESKKIVDKIMNKNLGADFAKLNKTANVAYDMENLAEQRIVAQANILNAAKSAKNAGIKVSDRAVKKAAYAAGDKFKGGGLGTFLQYKGAESMLKATPVMAAKNLVTKTVGAAESGLKAAMQSINKKKEQPNPNKK